MPAAARVSDNHSCPSIAPGPTPHVGGPILSGSPGIEIEFLPAARTTDKAQCAAGGPDVLAMGCPTVIFDNQLAVRVGDLTAHAGVVVAGSGTVEIGLVGDGAAVMPIKKQVAPRKERTEAPTDKVAPSGRALDDAGEARIEELHKQQDAIAAERQEIQRQVEAGEITEKEYLQRIDDLNDRSAANEAGFQSLKNEYDIPSDRLDVDGYPTRLEHRDPPVVSSGPGQPQSDPQAPASPESPSQPTPPASEPKDDPSFEDRFAEAVDKLKEAYDKLPDSDKPLGPTIDMAKKVADILRADVEVRDLNRQGKHAEALGATLNALLDPLPLPETVDQGLREAIKTYQRDLYNSTRQLLIKYRIPEYLGRRINPPAP